MFAELLQQRVSLLVIAEILGHRDVATFKILAAIGVKIPEDVSLVGFDDIEFAKIQFPVLLQ